MKSITTIPLFLGLLVALVFPSIAHGYYNPSTGKWLSRDPINERGRANLYAFVGNRPLTKVDLHGQKAWTDPDGGRCPRPIPEPTGPSGPCAIQQILGGPDSLEVQETAWFNLNYSGWVRYAIAEYTESISQALDAQCGKRRALRMPRMPVYPYYSGTWLCCRTAGGGNETDHEDKPQCRFSADKVLGSFVFMIEGPVHVSFSDDSSICCANGGQMKHFRWNADLIVYDVLGFQSEDLGYWISLGSCPTRGLVRARWKLNGTGACCTTPKPQG